jgi:hypothetical protein
MHLGKGAGLRLGEGRNADTSSRVNWREIKGRKGEGGEEEGGVFVPGCPDFLFAGWQVPKPRNQRQAIGI